MGNLWNVYVMEQDVKSVKVHLDMGFDNAS